MAVVDGGGGAVLLVGVAEADVERSSELASLSSRATILSNKEDEERQTEYEDLQTHHWVRCR